MSNTNNSQSIETFPVRLWNDKIVAESSNHRLVVLGWKEMKGKPAKSPKRCVSIPKVQIIIEPDCLAAALLAAFESIQDDYIRESIENDLVTNPTGTPKSINATDLQPSSIAAWNAEKKTSGHLSAVLIEAWFDATLEPVLAENFAAIPDMTDAKLATALLQRRNGLAKLASPHVSFPEAVTTQLLKAINKLEPATISIDPIAAKLANRLATLLKKEEITIDDL